jgi:predicted PurR-regulated permease PerM
LFYRKGKCFASILFICQIRQINCIHSVSVESMRHIPQPYIVRLAATLVSAFLIVLALYYLKVVMVPLLFSVIFAVMIFPFCVRLEKWGVSKGLSAFLSVLLFTFMLGIIVYIIYIQVGVFADHIPDISAKLNTKINEFRNFIAQKFSLKRSEVGNRIQEELARLQNGSISVGSLTAISSFLINVFLVPLYIFFIIYYRHFFIEFFYKLFYASDRQVIDDTLTKMSLVIKGYLFGQLLDIVIIGSINSIALYFIGVSYPIILGFVISLLCIIPYLGMIVGSLIALLVAFMTTDTSWQPLTAFTALWVIHIIDSNILAPLIVGSRVSLNPLMAIFVLFLFGELWGLPGLFLALPLTAIVKVIFDIVPGLKAFGFLLGEPEKYHLKKHSYLYIKGLNRFVNRPKAAKIPIPDAPVVDDSAPKA